MTTSSRSEYIASYTHVWAHRPDFFPVFERLLDLAIASGSSAPVLDFAAEFPNLCEADKGRVLQYATGDVFRVIEFRFAYRDSDGFNWPLSKPAMSEYWRNKALRHPVTKALLTDPAKDIFVSLHLVAPPLSVEPRQARRLS